MKDSRTDYINVTNFEEVGSVTNKNGIYIPEVKGFTPIQLNLVGPKPHPEVIGVLLGC